MTDVPGFTPAGGQGTPRAISRTPDTAAASTVKHPLGKPGGPGLFGLKGEELPAYVQNVRDEMMKNGAGEDKATQMALGIVRDWAAGHDAKGDKVSADVQAAAVKAMAQYDASRAKAKATPASRASVTQKPPAGDCDADGLDDSWDGDHSDLPDLTGMTVDHFRAVDSGGGDQPPARRAAPKPGTGARFANLRASLAKKGASDPGALAAYIGAKKYGKGKFTRLAAAARKSKGSPAMARSTAGELYRTYPLEECRIMRSGEGEGGGRVVEAYAAIFGTPAEIHDHEGHYEEEIDRGAFDDAIRSAHPDRHGGFWDVACLYNHGMTVHGTPAERFSVPAGVPKHVSAEGKGLLTRTEYAKTPLGDELLELVNMGALRTQSFTGGMIRSDPMLRGPGDQYRARGGILARVRRLALGLREYGLTPFAAYTGAEVLGVRMQLPGSLAEGIPDPADDEELTAADEAADGTGSAPADATSSRSTGNRLYQLRTEELLRQHGIDLPSQ